jgi:hypothetical protein
MKRPESHASSDDWPNHLALPDRREVGRRRHGGGLQGRALRYHYDSAYSNSGEAAFQRSNAAFERAMALDPNLISAAGQLITNRVERGELGRAYKDAKALVERHPENAVAHFALSYVLRYAGMLDESALLSAAKKCQSDFLSERSQASQ